MIKNYFKIAWRNLIKNKTYSLLKTIGLCIGLFCFSCNSKAQTDRTKGWHQDIDFLTAEIKKQHYVYRQKDLPAGYVTQIENLKKQTPQYSDERMLMELARALYNIGDGHTYILPFGANAVKSYFLPLQFYEFSDGLFVIAADEAHKRWIGAKVRQLGETKTTELLQDMTHLISADNTMGAKWIGPFFMRFRGYLETHGLRQNAADIELAFEEKNGQIVREKIPFTPVSRIRGIPKLVAPPHKCLCLCRIFKTLIGSKFFPKNKRFIGNLIK